MNKDKLQIGDLVIDRFELFRQHGVGLVIAPAKFARSGPIKGHWMVYFFKVGRARRYAENSLTKLSSTQEETNE